MNLFPQNRDWLIDVPIDRLLFIISTSLFSKNPVVTDKIGFYTSLNVIFSVRWMFWGLKPFCSFWQPFANLIYISFGLLSMYMYMHLHVMQIFLFQTVLDQWGSWTWEVSSLKLGWCEQFVHHIVHIRCKISYILYIYVTRNVRDILVCYFMVMNRFKTII